MDANQLGLLTTEIAFQTLITNFIIDRQARGRSSNTIRFYRDELGLFQRWLSDEGVDKVDQITPDILRAYFMSLEARRNKGGKHASARAIKAILSFWEEEEDGDYISPMHKVHVPPQKPRALPGIPISDIQRMIDTCKGPLAVRDQTALRALLDTGARGFEFVALDLGDIDLNTGAITIQHGKGDKERTVYVASSCRRWLKRYLKTRTHLNLAAPLWITDEGDRLTKRGLRALVERRAEDAGVPKPGLHDFRRAFALNMHRAGVDILTISRLMGHSSVEVTKRYIKESKDDLRIGHAKGSPVDNAGL